MRRLKLADGRIITFTQPKLMAVLNLTPDSFYDGGKYKDRDMILDFGREALETRAAVIDIGGESSRPGSAPVSAETELERIMPAVRMLINKFPEIVLSIDTYKEQVAEAALAAGAHIINDISAGEASNGRIFEVCRRFKAPIVLMHKKGKPVTMQKDPKYDNVVKEVFDYLKERMQSARDAGFTDETLILDPGIGFGKTMEHNIALLRNLGALKRLSSAPVLVGASMKRIIGDLIGSQGEERLFGTIGLNLAAVLNGADMVRVHHAKILHQSMHVFFSIFNRAEN